MHKASKIIIDSGNLKHDSSDNFKIRLHLSFFLSSCCWLFRRIFTKLLNLLIWIVSRKNWCASHSLRHVPSCHNVDGDCLSILLTNHQVKSCRLRTNIGKLIRFLRYILRQCRSQLGHQRSNLAHDISGQNNKQNDPDQNNDLRNSSKICKR
jgi:hypothetical protein